MKRSFVLTCLCAGLLVSSAAAALVRRQLLRADDIMAITGTAAQNGDMTTPPRYFSIGDDPLDDDVAELEATQQDDGFWDAEGLGDLLQKESGSLLPGAYGGPAEILPQDLPKTLGKYALAGGAYGGVLESSLNDSDNSSSTMESLPSANLAGTSSTASNTTTTATASGNSAAGNHSITAQVMLLAVAVAAALAM